MNVAYVRDSFVLLYKLRSIYQFSNPISIVRALLAHAASRVELGLCSALIPVELRRNPQA